MNQRYYSLDVFRGATVALMILVNNPGSWEHIYPPLEHAPWNGCTPTDLVFPFFLFAVGNAMAFVMPRLESAGNAVFLQKIFKRTLIIFGLGLFLNWFPFIRWSENHYVLRYWVNPTQPVNGVRILGVLQRIALCYLFASLLVYYCKLRGALIISACILLIYWVLCLYFGHPGDPYSITGYFGLGVDKAVLGVAHMYKGEGVPFDPEGLASTLPAIVQVVLGYYTGYQIVGRGKTPGLLKWMISAGIIIAVAGLCWNVIFPINKKIWTSSFVLFTSGLAMLVLAVLIYLIEFRGWKGWLSRFFDIFGKNPLFIFVMSGLIPRISGLIRWAEGKQGSEDTMVYTSPLEWFYNHICRPVSENLKNGSLLYAILMVMFFWLLGYIMDRKKIYIRV